MSSSGVRHPFPLDLDTVTGASLLTEEVIVMTVAGQDTEVVRALEALEDDRSSVRLRAALATGATPDPRYVDRLVERCATEPEFFVRDMLTWALTRHPVSLTLPALLRELRSERAQARSQALHTLSKTGDRQVWPAITRELLTDADDEVARSAWRAAVVLVPEGQEPALATVLATQLGRGGRETQLSLSQALVALGEVMVRPCSVRRRPRARTSARTRSPRGGCCATRTPDSRTPSRRRSASWRSAGPDRRDDEAC